MKKILPSILSADFTKLGVEIASLEAAGIDFLHIDIMDGHFVPNITFGPDMLKQIHKTTNLGLDVHLMISNPEQYIPSFAEAGASIITFHVETSKKPLSTIKQIKQSGANAGITLKPKTPVAKIEEFLPHVDLVLVMSVEPGFGGQAFMPESLKKIAQIDSLRKKQNLSVIIEVDGGVNISNMKDLSLAGVDYFVAGNAIFKDPDRKKIISQMKELL